jgi:hypothetical protein
MKKLILLIIAVSFVSFTNAQLLLNETFNYSSTKLANVAGDPNTSATNNTVGVWYNTGKAADSNSASIALDSEHCITPDILIRALEKVRKSTMVGLVQIRVLM